MKNILTFFWIVLSLSTQFQETLYRMLQISSIGNEENRYRDIIREHNLAQIEDHNRKIEGYKMAPNQFLSLSTEEFISLVTSRNNLPLQGIISHDTPQIGSTINMNVNLIVDWRAKGKISPIKNQGFSCDSCYAFVTTADIQSSFLLAFNLSFDFSEQQIIDCSTRYGNFQCNKGFYTHAFQYIVENGITTEANYPYRGTNQPCQTIRSRKYYISSYNGHLGNSCSQLNNLIKKRPVIVSVDGANSFWQFYSSGILANCGSNNVLNHGVQVAGIYQYSNGTNYYLLKNSWGTSWGENGYMKLDRNLNNGNLCSICSYPYHSVL